MPAFHFSVTCPYFFQTALDGPSLWPFSLQSDLTGCRASTVKSTQFIFSETLNFLNYSFKKPTWHKMYYLNQF